MQINILTLFPNFFKSSLNVSILKRAQEKKLVQFNIVNIRDFATDKHQLTDDRPYGGGPGMVMKIEPIDRALESMSGAKALKKSQFNILTSAKGKLFTQAKARQYSSFKKLNIVCGHYEGVDERVAEHLIDEEIRIGDYVLTGGESASLVIVDAVTRLIPGVLGNEASIEDESHSEPGFLTYPQYTRPEVYRNWKVPKVLLSGDHEKIAEWRRKQLIKSNL
ncbi:MAG: tRNA (guanosine(37)-N1)-methyltransferase TrmD [Candidatus Woesebacteria bacterium]|jgi:tRNA (guanine37-N1)-methyltransferase